ncbi:CPBP family intramembrane glutamic endopeptidase [Bryobacter aggregatus]|uniref:CPBP family intramembrane glutamic endopeptidase n=1 Tax=Bryobacter aggregatus TaxID=360054 RepID=UPI0004E1CFD7|nr:type II CAAX endopeptidase family protein [Bryobacter aggregatus]
MLYDHPQQPALPEGWFIRSLLAVAAIMRSFGALLSMGTSTILLTFAFEPLLPYLPMPRRLGENMVQGIPGLIMALLVSWLLLHYAHKLRLSDLGLSLDLANLRELAIWTLGGAFVLSLTVLPLLWSGAGQFTPSEAKIAGPGSLTIFLILLLISAMEEELIMRGYPFQTLVEPLHLLGALILTSGAFAALHWANPGANEFTIANTFLAGCALGLLLVIRRSMWAAIGAHFGWNLATILFGLNLSGLAMPIVPFTLNWTIDPIWTGGRYGPEGGLLCTIILSLLILIEVLIYHRQLLDTPSILADESE